MPTFEVQTDRTIVVDDDGAHLTLLNRFGADLVLRVDEEVRGLRALDDAAGYAVVIARGTGADTTFREYNFNPDGRQQGSETLLNTVQLLTLETVYDTDLNADGDIGFWQINDENPLARNDGRFQVFEVAGGGLAVFDLDEEESAPLPLVNGSGDFWQPAAGQEVVAIRQDGAGFRIIVEYDLRGEPAYFEFTVPASGEVARRGTALSEFEVVALELVYEGDINGDGEVDYIKTGEERVDRGAGDVAVWEISGNAFGIVVIAEGGEETIIPIVTSRGAPWSPGANQQPVAVRELDGGGFSVVVESVGAVRTVYSEITMNASGAQVGRAVSLAGTRLADAEVDYRTDINNDGIITVLDPRFFDLRLDPEAEVPLNFQGSTGEITLDAEEFGSGNLLALLGNGAVTVVNFQGTLNASGMSADLDVATVGVTTVEAGSADGDITVTGAGDPITVNDLRGLLDVSGTSGTVIASTADGVTTPEIITGSGPTSVDNGAGSSTAINALALTDELTLTGADGSFSVTNLAEDVDASGFGGVLGVTTQDNATLNTTTGSGDTTVSSNGSGTITVFGAALDLTSTLTLNGSSSFVSADLSDTTLAYAGSGTLDLTPRGDLTLNLDGSTGVATIDTSQQDGGALTINSVPATPPLEITGGGDVTIVVTEPNTDLSRIDPSVSLTVEIFAPGSTTLTAAQGTGSTVSGPAGSFGVTDADPAIVYDLSGVTVTNTTMSFSASGVVAPGTQFGSVNRLIAANNSTVEVTTDQAAGKSFEAADPEKFVFLLADGDNLDTAIPQDADMPANYDLQIEDGANVSLRVAQHEGAAANIAGAVETITLTTGGPVTAAEAIEGYVLSADGNEITVNSAKPDVDISGGDGNDTVIVGADLAVTGSYALGGGTNTLQLGAGANISGVNAGGATTAQTLVVDGGATMTTAQHEGFTTITGAGTDDVITLTTGGSVAAAEAIESYVLSADGNAITVNADKPGVNITGGDGNDTVIVDAGIVVTGSYVLGAGTNVLQLGDGASIAGVNGGAATSAQTLEVAGGATMTTAQHEGFTVITGAGTDDVITLTTGGSVAAAEAIESYVLSDAGNEITVNAANPGVNITGGDGNDTVIVGAGLAVTGSYDLGDGTNVLELGDGASIAGVNGGAATSAQTVEVAGGATMTTAQHEAFTTITGAGGADIITLTTGGAVTAAEAIEGYVLSDAGNEITVNAANPGVNITGGDGNDTVIVGAGLAVTGSYALGGGTNTLELGDGASISGATITGPFDIVLDADADVTISTAQHAAASDITLDGSNSITFGDANDVTGRVDTLYILADGDQIFTLGSGAQSVTTGSGEVTIVVGGQTLAAGTTIDGSATGDLMLSITADSDISAATLTGVNTLDIAENVTLTMTAAQAAAFGLEITGDGTVVITDVGDSGGWSCPASVPVWSSRWRTATTWMLQ